MKGRLIVIEGTDCSGKETQSRKLVDYLNENNIKACYLTFPMYDTPTGKIIGGPFLGKKEICEGYFDEKAPNVDGKVASLYFAADRLYNKGKITDKLDEGYTVILDRYVESNMAHQGGKLESKESRNEMYDFLYNLEFNELGLPKPDMVIFLYMPARFAEQLKKNRESLDQNEEDYSYLEKSEEAYLELASKYGFNTVNCIENESILTIDEIHEKVRSLVRK